MMSPMVCVEDHGEDESMAYGWAMVMMMMKAMGARTYGWVLGGAMVMVLLMMMMKA